MRKLLIFTIIGFAAQLVDGALGMAYGATSASLLLFFGVAPAVASASIHMAEIATTAASGASHIWFKNVDKTAVIRLIIPGSISAFIGAAFLSSLPGEAVRPFVSFFLLALGVYILLRFLLQSRPKNEQESFRPTKKLLTPLGLVGGFMDAVGGGGWGPIATPVLLSQKGSTPRKVIGTVDTSEFAIAVSATLGFAIFLGWEQFHWQWVIAFMIGGVAAAPLAAWLVKMIPSYLLGVLVGGFIILTNASTVIQSLDLMPASWIGAAYVLIIGLWISAIVYQVKNRKRFTAAQQ
ncbi:sulfite exporter TauE/SafE family protein [Paenibacillus turpanensis]|uniref:sulfite exporter TauE/SafE family protein n=1 Tax=Paenibacillus turpanensis TaxID=2689078 RepID=UPI00140CF736|nr:sulfite exporter TauE/SafE family protein [Paenibacillus turpanensis]